MCKYCEKENIQYVLNDDIIAVDDEIDFLGEVEESKLDILINLVNGINDKVEVELEEID